MKRLAFALTLLTAANGFARPLTDAEEVSLANKLQFESPERQVLCLDEDLARHPEIEHSMRFLSHVGMLDKDNCTNLNDDSTGMKKRLLRLVQKNAQAYTVEAALRPMGRYELVYRTSSLAVVEETRDVRVYGISQDSRDYLKTAGLVLGSVVLGNVLSNQIYAGEADKKKHAVVGGAIAVGATAASLGLAYIIPDETLSPTWKKLLIGCSGFIASTIAGIGKEVSDARDRTRHTVDRHDAYATSIGGGVGLGCVYSTKF